MQALRLTQWGKKAELCETSVPEPGPGQVLIAVAGAGACHSDLHLMDWPEGLMPWQLPFTIGHENAGHVEAVGAGVTSFKKGDAVLVYGSWGCGQCRPCRLSRENYCDNARRLSVSGGGLGLDGGMAEYMLIPSERCLIPIGDFDPIRAAPLADAALSPYHAIATSAHRLYPGSTAVVIGVGGLGQMAIQLLKLTTGACVIAVDSDARKLRIARSLGADHAVESDYHAVDAIRGATGGGGADVILDMVGSDTTLALAARSLRAQGRLVIIGLAGGRLDMSFFAVPYGAEVATSYWGTATELTELVALARAGKLRVDVEVFPLERALDAYDRLRRGEIRGRAVVVPER